MAGRTPTIAVILTASLMAPEAAAEPKAGGGECLVTRILPDGREIRSAEDDVTTSTSRGRNGSSAHASSSSHGSSHAASSTSVSSSSSSGSHGSSARAVSSHTDEQGRTVTTTRDENGCRTVIDERE